MSKKKLLIASLGLTACLCWAMASSMAETPTNSGVTNNSGGGSVLSDTDTHTPLGPNTPGLNDATAASHEDPGYLGLFGVVRLEDVLPEGEPQPEVKYLDERYFRIIPADQLRQAPDDEEPGTRGDSACNNISYNNQVGGFVAVSSLNFPFGVADDCRLSPLVTDTSICSATVRTFGNGTVGGPVYDLTLSVFSDCPELTGTLLIATGSYAAIPNDGFYRHRTIDVSPDYRDADSTIWVGMQSNNADGFNIIAGDTVDNISPVGPDIGSTLRTFAIPNGAEGCDLFQFVNQSIYGGMSITLRGTRGPLGCCCNTLDGMKTASFAGDCDAYTQSWFPTDCASSPACNICTVTSCDGPSPGPCNPLNLECEPDCTTNYVDQTNRGCADRLTFNPATTWKAIASAPASGCGRTGTYQFLNGTFTENRRDQDNYLLILTQDTRVTWKLRGNVPMQGLVAFTIRQTNLNQPLSCGLNLTTAATDTPIATSPACEDAIAHACLPGRAAGFRYLLVARPAVNAGIPCNSSFYQWEVTTAPCTFPTSGACCTPTGCIVTSPLGCLIGFNQYQGDSTDPDPCGTLSPPCVGTPTNDTCTGPKVIFANMVDVVIPFDTTFANSETSSYTQSTPIFKDVWFEYIIPSIGSATQGRLAVSTIGTCFNSKVAVFEVRNSLAHGSVPAITQTQKCANGGGNGLQSRGNGVPYLNTTGTPSVPLAGYCYVDTAQGTGPAAPFGIVTGKAYKIRVGGINDSEFGQGFVRISFVPGDDPGPPWDLNAGRCCLPGGGCIVAPFDQPPITDTTPDNCLELGGFITNTTDFQQGNSDPGNPATAEFRNVGCASIPCPIEGEACWNALDFNALVGGGFGTITRVTTNTLYVKYSVPHTTPIGSAIVINSCGSINFGVNFLDTAMAVYNSFNIVSGECDGNNNAVIGDNDECGPDDTSSSGAADRADCYGGRGGASCLCFTVVSASPGAKQVMAGAMYWIALGSANGIGGPRLYIDPRRNDCNVPVSLVLQITNPATCFQCNRPPCIPGGSVLAENEGGCNLNYVDTTNAGCSAFVPANQLFKPITCGQTYCGQSATFRTNPPCLTQDDCAAGDTCTPAPGPGFCEDDTDNSRDFDWYRVVVTTPSRLSWLVSADFPSAIQVVASPNATDPALGTGGPTNTCLGTVLLANEINLNQCDNNLAEVDVCPGVYYLSVTVATEVGTPCTVQRSYTATLTCSSPSTAAGACCKGDMNNDGRLNGTDIQLWLNEVRQTSVSLDKSTGCFNLSTCRADFTNDYAVTVADVAGLVSAMVGKPACPAAVCGDSSSCHLPAADDSGIVSDLGPGLGGNYRAVDDFRVTSAGTSQQITKVCWWGFYFDYANLTACSPIDGFGDAFSITVYNDAGGLPGTKLAGPITSFASLTKTGLPVVNLNYLGRKVRRFSYEATLTTPVNVASNGCYWLEIVNNTTTCRWHWETSKVGNGVTAQKNGGPAGKENWSVPDLVVGSDLAWCLQGIRVSNVDCGLPQGRCCVYPGQTNCTITSQQQCVQVLGGVWTISSNCSASPPCPLLPANDNCPNAQIITANVLYTGSTNFATKSVDSVPMTCEQSCGGQCNGANDLWYKWENNDPGFGGPIDNPVFSMCDGQPPFRYDSMMVIYTGCPTAGGVPTLPGCCDDCCDGASGPSRIGLSGEPTGLPGFCTVGLDCYLTYWIRISGWQGTNGNFTLKVFRPAP